MTNLSVKDIGAMMGRTGSVNVIGSNVRQADAVSFESVWSNQTEKNNTSDAATEGVKPVRKEEDAVARDSLQTKDSHKSVVKQGETAEEIPANDLREMSPEEWEKAMEVLGAAAVEMIQQVADTFGMTVEEVQGLMNELGLESLDVLQQEGLGKLILAAGGAQDATGLLTNEELYQQFQSLMGELNSTLEKVGETLQVDVQQLVTAAAEDLDKTVGDELPIEITVEEDLVADSEKVSVEDTTEIETEDTADDVRLNQPQGAVVEENGEEQQNAQMQKNSQGQNLTQGQETEIKQSANENKAQGENLVLQSLKTDNFEPQLQQVTQTVSTWDNETVNIMKQIMDYMRIQVKPDMSNLEMQLHPENLGTLQIHVASKEGVVTAQFVTQNETVKAVLESQMIQLKENFAEQGVKVEAIEVTVQTHQFKENLEQGRGRQQEDTARRSRPRRIQLDGNLTMDDLGVMEEDEQLAAEMMAANGNTVDYTA
uniref:flagellar hook-length control protein FliK n=1 Tax=Acetatifactor sp. TaxID=1872090 RepID=UPI00405671BC